MKDRHKSDFYYHSQNIFLLFCAQNNSTKMISHMLYYYLITLFIYNFFLKHLKSFILIILSLFAKNLVMLAKFCKS